MTTPEIRDRIIDFKRIKASELLKNPRNWRRHPPSQRRALEGVLQEVGYADALLARETPDGLELIDGHLRAETTPDMEVPVLILDLTEEEANLVLATLDPLAAMATTDLDLFLPLAESIASEHDMVQRLLEAVANSETIPLPNDPGGSSAGGEAPNQGAEIQDAFSIIVACTDESHQAEVFEKLTEEGYQCRALVS